MTEALQPGDDGGRDSDPQLAQVGLATRYIPPTVNSNGTLTSAPSPSPPKCRGTESPHATIPHQNQRALQHPFPRVSDRLPLSKTTITASSQSQISLQNILSGLTLRDYSGQRHPTQLLILEHLHLTPVLISGYRLRITPPQTDSPSAQIRRLNPVFDVFLGTNEEGINRGATVTQAQSPVAIQCPSPPVDRLLLKRTAI